MEPQDNHKSCVKTKDRDKIIPEKLFSGITVSDKNKIVPAITKMSYPLYRLPLFSKKESNYIRGFW